VNWKAWIYSIIAAAIGGAATALSAVIVAPATFNFTGAGWTNLWHMAVVGAIIPVLTLLKQSPLPVIPGSSAGSTTKVGCWALIFLLLQLPFVQGCNAQTVAQDIVNWTPTIVSAAQTIDATLAALDPADAPVILLAGTSFTAAARLVSNQANTYLANPSADTLHQLQAQALAFQGNVNNALLQAARISNPISQQKITAAINAAVTGISAILALIMTIKGNTLTPAAVAAPKLAQVLPLINQDQEDQLIAAHYKVPIATADYLRSVNERLLIQAGF
jgi:hypothetical protein